MENIMQTITSLQKHEKSYVFSDFEKFNEKSVREMYCKAAVWGYLGLQDAKAVLAASRKPVQDKKEDESGGDPGNDEEIPF